MKLYTLYLKDRELCDWFDSIYEVKKYALEAAKNAVEECARRNKSYKERNYLKDYKWEIRMKRPDDRTWIWEVEEGERYNMSKYTVAKVEEKEAFSKRDIAKIHLEAEGCARIGAKRIWYEWKYIIGENNKTNEEWQMFDSAEEALDWLEKGEKNERSMARGKATDKSARR